MKLNDHDIRDDFFVEINWCIVRFSELQVIKEPENCVKTIKNIINLLEYGLTEWSSYVKKDKCWNIEEAKIMAESSYREKYLGISEAKHKGVRKNIAEPNDEKNNTKEGLGGYFPL